MRKSLNENNNKLKNIHWALAYICYFRFSYCGLISDACDFDWLNFKLLFGFLLLFFHYSKYTITFTKVTKILLQQFSVFSLLSSFTHFLWHRICSFSCLPLSTFYHLVWPFSKAFFDFNLLSNAFWIFFQLIFAIASSFSIRVESFLFVLWQYCQQLWSLKSKYITYCVYDYEIRIQTKTGKLPLYLYSVSWLSEWKKYNRIVTWLIRLKRKLDTITRI